ncbi:MAG: hypothetical protein USCGTAYLOR_00287 [Chromatiales bacterium USCg_Taylor]|nr:MAG: hypothetical protein USCGTAYLOR_00287 [Chromatiales bacterium USCg_Taylor]
MLTSRLSIHIAALVLAIGLCVPAAGQAWNFGYRSSQGSHAYGGYGYRHQSPRYSYYQPHYRHQYRAPWYGYHQPARPHRPYRHSYYYPYYRWCLY